MTDDPFLERLLDFSYSLPGVALRDGRFLHVWPFFFGQIRLVVTLDEAGFNHVQHF